ncbi:hypothetical protein [Natrialba chahannaoensis]|uniref:hypothetical protein n=1 Tax=Natrialba chahannaoensis TaxID=68911 RepID=UPI0013758FAD|nr:hypothetical protein [Natrialba chahannaoensis]
MSDENQIELYYCTCDEFVDTDWFPDDPYWRVLRITVLFVEGMRGPGFEPGP